MFLMDSTTLIVLVAVGAVVLIIIGIVAWYISTSNKFHIMTTKIDEAESGIDVALTKRYDLLTKLFQIAKGFAKHERETLEAVIAMRNPGAKAQMSEKIEFNSKMTEAMNTLNVVSEKYPELQANSNFVTLSHATIEVEEQLQAARRLFNSNVSIYNQRIKIFPSSFVARRMGLLPKEFFQAEDVKKKDVEFNF